MRNIQTLAVLLLLISNLYSQSIPGTISYQGILMQNDGITPLADGSHTVLFKFYTVPSGGTALAGMDKTVTVTTTKGLFTCIIGGGTAPNASFSAGEMVTLGSQQIYIGITVDGGSELAPRAQTTPATYALQAQSAYTISDNAVTSAKIADGSILNADINVGAAIVDTKLATISTPGKVSGAAITSGTIGGSTTINTTSTVTAASFSGNGSALTAIGSAAIQDGSLIDADISASAAIADSKLGTISSAGKVLGGSITSGAIGGTTSINSSGSIRTTGEIRGGDEDFPGSVAVQGNNGVDYGTISIIGHSYGVLGGSASGSTNWGVYGGASGTGSSNYGVYGIATAAAVNNYGVFGDATGATGKNWAGYFDDGNVYIKGQVGIGTTDPAFKLDISQAITGGTPVARVLNTANSSTADVLWIQGGSNTTAGAYLLSFYRPDGTIIGRIQQNSSTSVTYSTTSDFRLKDLYGVSKMGLNDLMKLSVYDYKYKNDSSGKTIMGFIAQEVNDLFPQAVIPPKNDGENDPTKNPWMMDYSSLTPLITKSVQEQQFQIEKLKSHIIELERRLSVLESQPNLKVSRSHIVKSGKQ